jgi:peptide/nickel transport system ATP-binding protein
MYAGRIVETGMVDRLFRDPRHPYTQGLLGSIPSRARPGTRLPAIPGTVPALHELPSGCVFEPRCPEAFARCPSERPPLYELGGAAGESRCFLSDPDEPRAAALRRTA